MNKTGRGLAKVHRSPTKFEENPANSFGVENVIVDGQTMTDNRRKAMAKAQLTHKSAELKTTDQGLEWHDQVVYTYTHRIHTCMGPSILQLQNSGNSYKQDTCSRKSREMLIANISSMTLTYFCPASNSMQPIKCVHFDKTFCED